MTDDNRVDNSLWHWELFFIVLLPTIPICSKVNVNINLEQGVETGGCMDGHAPNVEISLHDPFLNFW